MKTIRLLLNDGADAYGLRGKNGDILHSIDPDLAERMVRSGHAAFEEEEKKPVVNIPQPKKKKG
jgi:hypothetical protein